METLLKVEELIPYLPYNLKIIDGWGDKRTMKYTHLDDNGNNGVIFGIKPILRPISDLLSEVSYNIHYENTSTYLEFFSNICDLPFYESGYYSDTITRDVENGIYSIYDRNNHRLSDFSYLKYDSKNIKYITYHEEKDEVSIPYKMYQLLFEYHFDVYGLIDRNLAVNINNIK